MCQVINGKSALSYCWANVMVSKTPITAGLLAMGVPLSSLYLFWFHASPTACIIRRPSTLLPDSRALPQFRLLPSPPRLLLSSPRSSPCTQATGRVVFLQNPHLIVFLLQGRILHGSLLVTRRL